MSKSSSFYEKFLRSLLFRLDPETAHHFAIASLTAISRVYRPKIAVSEPGANLGERKLFGLTFPNAVGLAAGLDKCATALPAWQLLGFGFVEAGTITALAQPGNPKPRVFRYPRQQALVNRFGFNNDGADAVAARLAKLKTSGRWPTIPVGLNIGKAKITPLEEATADYLDSFEKLYAFGDYFVLNVSSPNTPGLRTLQNKESLDELMRAVQSANRDLAARHHLAAPKPLLVKIAPDLEFSQIEEILALIEEHQLAGIIATNTTLDHSSIPETERQQGGLSGAPLRTRSTEIVRFIATHSKFPVIAVGGIFSADDAQQKFDAGAALVQLYTGFIYRGPALIREICKLLER